MPKPTIAAQLANLIEGVLGAPPPVRLRAWDGSEAGAVEDPTAPVVIVRRRRALRRLLWSPGELGLARAFVSGDLDFEGDIADASFYKDEVLESRLAAMLEGIDVRRART